MAAQPVRRSVITMYGRANGTGESQMKIEIAEGRCSQSKVKPIFPAVI